MSNYPPGPKGPPVLGNAIAFRKNPIDFINKLTEYGSLSFFRLGPIPAYFVNEPDYIHQILVTDADKVWKDPLTKIVGGKFAGNGLITNDGDSHRRQRKLMQPAFHHKRLEGYAAFMTQQICDSISHWQQGQELILNNEMIALTLRVVAKTLLNADVADDTDAAMRAMELFHEVTGTELREPIPLPDWLPIERKRKMRESLKTLDTIVHRIIEEHRSSGKDQGDLLSTLIDAVDEDDGGQMTPQQLRDEAVTLFIAGHETTASLLIWTFYLLGCHPQIAARVQEEVDHVIGDRLPTFADLPQLCYIDLVIKETLRLYPSAWLFSRQAIADCVLGDYTLRKGSYIFISPNAMHHDPRFFEDPEAFIPERFEGTFEKQLPKCAYLPFGAGPRICIGQHFALMEAKLAIATIMSKFEIHIPDTAHPGLLGLAALKPANQVQMTVTHRQGQVVG